MHWRLLWMAVLSLAFSCRYTSADTGIVVLGSGVVNALGRNSDEFWQNLKEGKSGIRRIRNIQVPADFAFPWAAEVPYSDDQLTDALKSCPLAQLRGARRIDRQSLFAIHATVEALLAANLVYQERPSGGWVLRPEANRVGVAIGSTLGGPLLAAEGRALMRSLFKSPSEVAMALGLDGICTGTTGACAAGLNATIVAVQTLLADDADVMVAGATDAQITQLGLLARNAVLSKLGPARPFDKAGDGTTLGEGSAVLVLGRESYARRHGYPIVASIAGYSARVGGNDFTGLEPTLVARTVREAIGKAKIRPEEIGAIFAHAPGTRIGDESELAALREVFGSLTERIPIVSLTSRIGHPLGPSGSMRLAAALRVLEEQFLFGNLNLEHPRPGFEAFNLVGPAGVRLENIRYVLVNSFGLGGQYGAMVLRRYP